MLISDMFLACRLPRLVLPAAVRFDMVLHKVFRARHVQKNGIGGEARHGVTSGVSRETSLNRHVAPHFHRECLDGPQVPCEKDL